MIGWINIGGLDVDCFVVKKMRSSDIPLDYFLDKIDLDNYWIYKGTRNFIRVEVEDIGKYSGYIFFKKDIYCKEYIDKWIVEIYKIQSMPYLSKPFPRLGILSKIEVV